MSRRVVRRSVWLLATVMAFLVPQVVSTGVASAARAQSLVVTTYDSPITTYVSSSSLARAAVVAAEVVTNSAGSTSAGAAVSGSRVGVAAKGVDDVAGACAGGKCGIPGGTCFVAGTKIRTEHGLKPIEDVKVGERVWSRNLETGKDELRPVLETYVRHAETLLKLTIAGSVLTTTEDHPFMVKGRGWTKAGALQVGDVLVTPTGTTPLAKVETVPHGDTVYNFQVEVDHNYYALAGATPVLVHNANYGYRPSGGAADFDLDELAQLTHQHTGAGDIAGRPGLDEIRNVLDRGVPTRIRQDAVQLDFQGVRVIVNESMPWKSTSYYPGS